MDSAGSSPLAPTMHSPRWGGSRSATAVSMAQGARMTTQPERFVRGGWAHRVEGGLDGDGWTVSIDANPHRIDIDEPSLLEAAPRIKLDGDRLKPKLRLAYNATSTAPFRLGNAEAQLHLFISAPSYLERLRRLLVGSLRRLPIFFWMPHLAVSPNDAGIAWRYTVIVEGTELGTIVWSPGRGFEHAPPAPSGQS